MFFSTPRDYPAHPHDYATGHAVPLLCHWHRSDGSHCVFCSDNRFLVSQLVVHNKTNHSLAPPIFWLWFVSLSTDWSTYDSYSKTLQDISLFFFSPNWSPNMPYIIFKISSLMLAVVLTRQALFSCKTVSNTSKQTAPNNPTMMQNYYQTKLSTISCVQMQFELQLVVVSAFKCWF